MNLSTTIAQLLAEHPDRIPETIEALTQGLQPDVLQIMINNLTPPTPSATDVVNAALQPFDQFSFTDAYRVCAEAAGVAFTRGGFAPDNFPLSTVTTAADEFAAGVDPQSAGLLAEFFSRAAASLELRANF